MVEPGQVVTQALKAEFGEEAMAKLSVTDEEREKISILVERLFKEGVEVMCCSNATLTLFKSPNSVMQDQFCPYNYPYTVKR